MSQDSQNKSEAALREEQILKFWQENKIFEKTLKKSKLYSPLPKNKLSTSLKKTRENKIKKLFFCVFP